MLKFSLLNRFNYLSIALAYSVLSELSLCLMLNFLLKFNYFFKPQKSLVSTILGANEFYFNNMLREVSSPFICLTFPPDDFIWCSLILVLQETVSSSCPHSFSFPFRVSIASLSSLSYLFSGSGISVCLSIPDMKPISYLQWYLLTFPIPCIMLLYPFWEQHTVFRGGVYHGFIQWSSFILMGNLVSSVANSITFWTDAKWWQKVNVSLFVTSVASHWFWDLIFKLKFLKSNYWFGESNCLTWPYNSKYFWGCKQRLRCLNFVW